MLHARLAYAKRPPECHCRPSLSGPCLPSAHWVSASMVPASAEHHLPGAGLKSLVQDFDPVCARGRHAVRRRRGSQVAGRRCARGCRSAAAAHCPSTAIGQGSNSGPQGCRRRCCRPGRLGSTGQRGAAVAWPGDSRHRAAGDRARDVDLVRCRAPAPLAAAAAHRPGTRAPAPGFGLSPFVVLCLSPSSGLKPRQGRNGANII